MISPLYKDKVLTLVAIHVGSNEENTRWWGKKLLMLVVFQNFRVQKSLFPKDESGAIRAPYIPIGSDSGSK